MPVNATDTEIVVAPVSNLFGFEQKSDSKPPENPNVFQGFPELQHFYNIIDKLKGQRNTTVPTSGQSTVESKPVQQSEYYLIDPDYHKKKYEKNLKTSAQKETYAYLNSIADADTSKYLVKLAHLESGFTPDVKNRLGYVGAFQFGESALSEMISRGVIDNMDKESFRNAPIHIQASAAAGLANLNWKIIKNDAEALLDKKINGVKVTKKGLMAASHLVGASDVKTWLRTRGAKTSKDANGITIEKYLREFQNL
jgi:hypothetical protein